MVKKKQQTNNIIIMIALLAVIYLFANNTQLFSTAGTTLGGRHDAACTFITNAEVADYNNAGVWVSFDSDNDGTKEGYTLVGYTLRKCGTSSSQDLGVTPEGYLICKSAAFPNSLTIDTKQVVGQVSNQNATSFSFVKSNATNIALTCPIITVNQTTTTNTTTTTNQTNTTTNQTVAGDCLFKVETFCVKLWMVLTTLIVILLMFLLLKK